MGHHELIAEPPTEAASDRLSLADVIARLAADSSLALPRQREMTSALRTLARWFDAEPASVPADPRTLRLRLATLSPASGGISTGRWNNVRSLALAALRQAGVRTLGRARAPLAPAWQALRARLPDARARLGLSRFMSFCSARQIAPEAVDTETFAAFRAALDGDSLVAKPHVVHRTACVLWNRAAQTIDGWPRLTVPVPSTSRRYAYEWDSFPPPFRADAEAFLAHSADQDPFADDYAPSVRASTVAMRRKQILELATALAKAGFPLAEITGLAVLVAPENARRALRFLMDRAGGRQTKYLHQQALLLKTIARHWVRAEPAQIEALGQICRRLAVKNTGMTERNKARLRQFDDPTNIAALINLPARVRREIRHADAGGRRDALRVMFALAVELLLVAPLRINNLTGLEIARHFVRSRRGGAGVVHLVIPAHETKNGAPYELALPKDTASFLADYLANYHTRLAPGPSPWLFPNDQDGRRNTTSFATEIVAFIRRETGIEMNVHLFRHLAAKLHLEAYPEDIETARRILGHQNITTTLRSYAETKTAAAFRRYDAIIAGLRDGARFPLEPVTQRRRVQS